MPPCIDSYTRIDSYIVRSLAKKSPLYVYFSYKKSTICVKEAYVLQLPCTWMQTDAILATNTGYYLIHARACPSKRNKVYEQNSANETCLYKGRQLHASQRGISERSVRVPLFTHLREHLREGVRLCAPFQTHEAFCGSACARASAGVCIRTCTCVRMLARDEG